MSGWYAMKRGWLDHEIFAPVGAWSKAEAWVWMVEAAAFKPTVIDIGGKPYTVPRGALCYSERFLSDKFKWSRKALQTFLSQLEAHGVVQRSVARTGTGTKSKRSQITLCNYEKYQAIGAKTEPKGDQKGTKEEQVNKGTIPLPSEEDASASSAPLPVSMLSSAVWELGKRYLSRPEFGIKDPGRILGKWLRDHDHASVLNAIDGAHKSGTQDPIPYITAALRPKSDLDSVWADVLKEG